MNLTKLTLVSCPAILAALVMVSNPAEASTPANLLQLGSVGATTDHHAVSVSVVSPSDRPLLPTGCSCARCTKVDQLLQGQFPVF
ncbi:MAG: hypothetical protein HC780_01405 [Leptolyngbyaceae cyanobacterium CSU_1_3]|nr:hypothetical protein [Leptolyngbyaceae cyanobacterium CSU_1_3]